MSLVAKSWVMSNNFEQHVRPLHELFEQTLVIKSVSGDELVHVGWIDIEVSIDLDRQGVNVPFLVTRLELDKPGLCFNVIKEFL